MHIQRIALLIPHSDTTLETDLQCSLPDGYILHTHRLWLDEVGEEAEQRMVDVSLPAGLKYLQGITTYDKAVFGCTSAAAVYGKAGLLRLEKLMEKELGCPSISALGAVLAEIKKRNNPQLALVTPYTEMVNRFMVRSLQGFGVTVSYQKGLGLAEDTEIAKVSPRAIREFVLEQKDEIRGSSGALFLSCTNFRALEVRAELEGLLGMDVITSNHGILQWILKAP